ncbi:PAS domain S-box protein [Algoriphagus sp. AGSA1]|uniref:PAS domain-containing hybrid sensor histidine kinase/response regulator n=1 Tax=Algoriphagus sp. AGSA1 TaxID=2907213 RepID=UPI001F2C2B51|nr:PAS domain S-box protein [Algoriphagus sp. AGSA1]MCE7054660.1 PAS domain S-box protein [Algoriphagus sp. AGSA1]
MSELEESRSASDKLSTHPYQSLDADQDVSLYRICQLSSIVSATPKSLILFVDPENRFKASSGFELDSDVLADFLIEKARNSSSFFLSQDLQKDELPKEVPLALEAHEIGAFAGLSFKDENADWVGGLFVLGADPIKLDDKAKIALELLASEALIIVQERKLITEFSNVEKFFNLSNDLICIAGTNGYFKKVNPSFSRLLGWDNETLLTRSFFELTHPDDIKKTRRNLEKLINGELSTELSHRFMCRDGSYKSLDWVATKDPKTGNIYSIARDTTEAKAKEEQLAKSENRLRVFFENSQGLMCTHDLEGVFLSVNEAGAQMLGYTAEQVIGRSLYDIVPESRHPLIDQYLMKIQNEGKASGQMVSTHRNGSNLIWIYNNVLERDSSGGGDYVIGNAIDISSRVKLEEELSRARAMLEETEIVARVGGWNLDLKSQKLTWTSSTKLIHEVPMDYEPDLATAIDFYKEGENRSKIQAAFEMGLKTGEGWDLELQIITARGNELWVRAIGKLEFVNGECIRIFGTFQDIDVSKKSQIELEQTRKVLDDVINASSEVCVISTGLDGMITVFNVGAEKMLGYSAGELVGKQSPIILYKPEEIEAYRTELEKEFGREIHSSEILNIRPRRNGFEQRDWTFVTKKGDEKVVSLVVSAMRDHEDQLIGYLGIAIDITDKNKIEKDLYNEKSRLNAFVTHAPAAVAMLDNNMVYIAASNQYKKDYNLQGRDIIGKSHYDVFPQTDELSRDRFERVLAGSIERKEEEKIKLPGETEERFVSWEMRPWYLHDGDVGGMMMFVQDITRMVKHTEELNKAKLLAEEANVAKSEFLANMSHEIRTPLNGVIGFTDLVLKTNLNETQHQYLSIVHQSGNALLSIINDILDFSKIEAGRLELDIDKCDIYELCSQATDIITYQIQNKGLEMLLNMATDLPRFVFADSVRLKQILVNLLGNSSKFTEQGEIELKIEIIEKKGDFFKLRFSVRDTGIGIKPEKQSKIFEAFSQEDSSTTKKYGGTGLGLTISNSLLRLMGSKLELESELGKGSTFYFDVLLETEQGEPIDWYDVDKISNVLIVDDNANNRLIVRGMLLLKNIQSVEASNGFEALQVLASGKEFDVILMDYHMPFMDGLETIRKIRETFPAWSSDEPILLLHSSSDDHKIIESCRELRVRHRLIKPVKIQDFYLSLSRLHKIEMSRGETGEVVTKGAVGRFIVLIAEDNLVNMLLARTLLKKIAPEATVVEVKNGQEAVDYCQEQMPDIILMDVQMPEMNGYEATKQIRLLEHDARVPIIALTAGNVKGEREKCLASGMDDFVVKPIVEETIKMILDKWLNGITEAADADRAHHEDKDTHYCEEKLRLYADNDPELLQEILGIASVEITKSMESLKAAIQEENLLGLTEAGHKLYGTAISSGMQVLAGIAREFEHLEEFETEQVAHMYGRLLAEIKLVKEMMQSGS